MDRRKLIAAAILGIGLIIWLRMRSGSGQGLNVSVKMGGGGGIMEWITGTMSESDVLNAVIAVKQQYPMLSGIPDMLVLGIAKTESSLRPSVRGDAGEYGLMQIMPGTWAEMEGRYGVTLPDWTDPFQNVLCGMLVLYDYNRQLQGNWGATVHAYNVGMGGFMLGRRNDEYAAKVAANMGIALG